MQNTSRREFLGFLGAAAALSPLHFPLSKLAASVELQTAELVLFNGNILTIDKRSPEARALAIAGGRFIAVGSNDEVMHLVNSRTKKVDLENRTVVPGFIDAHSHPS